MVVVRVVATAKDERGPEERVPGDSEGRRGWGREKEDRGTEERRQESLV